MAREIVMGLTTTDFGASLKNTLGYAMVGCACIAVAAITAAVVRAVLDRFDAFMGGTIAGIAATRFLVKYVPYILLPDQTALKFLILFVGSLFVAKKLTVRERSVQNLFALGFVVIAFTGVGGMFAHLGRGQLYVVGGVASVVGGGLVGSARDSSSSSRKQAGRQYDGYL